MKLYYIDTNQNHNGYHELHVATCVNLPNIFNRKHLGNYSTLSEASRQAKKNFLNMSLCSNCIQEALQLPIPFYKKWFRKK